MPNKPIIFSTDMVRAILDGRQTQTRRVIKPQPPRNFTAFECNSGNFLFAHSDRREDIIEACKTPVTPPHQVGDVLWVRETWCANGKVYRYKAEYSMYENQWKWRPSTHMPREAARLFLRVTSVRAERLQYISGADAQSEGVIPIPECGSKMGEQLIHDFAVLWDKLNAKRGDGAFAWDKNPWVWVYSFERALPL